MQVNSISSFNSMDNVRFEGKKQVKQYEQQANNSNQNSGFMSKVAAPAVAAMFLVPVLTSTPACTELEATAEANASAEVEVVVPRSDLWDFPQEIQDSLNLWRGKFIKIPVIGDDDTTYINHALLYMKMLRNWEYNRPESWLLDLKQSDSCSANYTHRITDSIYNNVNVKLVKSGKVVEKDTTKRSEEIVLVKKNGTIIHNAGGLLFNEDGVKSFAHSNGNDKIILYAKATSGDYEGKYVELGTYKPGYLYDIDEKGNRVVLPEYGYNMLLTDIISPGTEDHYIQAVGKSAKVEGVETASGTQWYIVEKNEEGETVRTPIEEYENEEPEEE